MKSKGILSYSISMLAALIAVLICVPLRVYQYNSIIDAQTGFYNDIDFSVYVVYGLLLIAMIIGIVVPYIRHKKIVTSPSQKKSIPFTIVSLLMAIGIIIDSAVQLIHYFELYEVDLNMMQQTISEYVSSQGGTLLLLQAIFGGLAAVYFFVSGISTGIGNADGSKFRLLALLPVVWSIFRLLYRFKRTISFVNVSDLLVELFMIVFAMMFFLAYAQVSTKVDASTVFWKLFAYGVPAAMFALVCFLPRLCVSIPALFSSGDLTHLTGQYGVNFSDIAFTIFVIYNLVSRARIENTDSNSED